MKLRISCACDIGCLRDNNEDIAAVGQTLTRDGSLTTEREVAEDGTFCLLVSDGMGGHESGEYASRYTLEALLTFLTSASAEITDPPSGLKARIKEISDSLNREALGRRQRKAMGCTLCGIVWMKGMTMLVNAGDSRTYLLRDGKLRQLTSDETIHERDMVPLPAGKALYNCIGAFCDTKAYVQDISGLLQESDRILVCSDGLTDMLEDSRIESVLSGGSPEESRNALVNAAKRSGGIDNVTVIVADILR